MQTKSLIQANANVIKIVNLKKGDVYKRIEERYSNDYEVRYGVVQNIYNDGENTHIETLEYNKSFSDISVNLRVFSGKQDLSIYPVSIEEISEHFESMILKMEKGIVESEEELAKKKKALSDGRKFVSGEMAKELSVIEYKELSQGEYNEEKKQKEEAIKALQD